MKNIEGILFEDYPPTVGVPCRYEFGDQLLWFSVDLVPKLREDFALGK